MSKKFIVPSSIVFIVLLSLIWWQLTPKGKNGIKTSNLPMKISKNFWPGQYWLSIAGKKGWFKKAGLNVELIDAKGDYFGSLQKMIDGKLDGNNFALFDMIKFNSQGKDLVMVLHTDNSFGGDAIVAKSTIAGIRELKGKKVGVTQNTYLEYILDVVLDNYRIPLSDLTFVHMQGEKVAEAFIKGSVDAIVTWEPHVSKAIKKGSGKKLFDTSEIPGISPAGFVFRRSFIEARPEDVQAFIQVWHKTTQFIKERPKEAFAIIAEIYKTTSGAAQAFAQNDRIMDLRENIISYTYAAGFESLYGASRKINKFMIKKNMTPKQLDSTKFIEPRFIRALKQSLR